MDAKPYREGKTWSMRRRVYGQNFHVAGFATAGGAQKAMRAEVLPSEIRGQPAGLGPDKTTLAQALQDYGVERLPFLKGSRQEANRINKYLRAAGLQTLALSPATSQMSSATDAKPAEVQPGKKAKPPKVSYRYWDIKLEAPTEERKVPPGLGKHRTALATARSGSDALRGQLARTPMAKVMRYQVQPFFDALISDGLEAATLQLERAVLRRVFNYAHTSWNWSSPLENPATHLALPMVDNGRERVMSSEEQALLDKAIQKCRNALHGPLITLLTETAMRASEPLSHARWADVDWARKVLHLSKAKAGQREVPLSPKAIVALERLRELSGSSSPDDRVVCVTYEALKGAWNEACKTAKVTDLHLQDLRHTAATRMALKTGNIFLVKALTGHKTLEMVQRYVNVNASDVVSVMHGETTSHAAAALTSSPANLDGEGDRPPNNVLRFDFGKRRIG